MKKQLGPRNCLYPLPVTLVGATVAGKPNFAPIAHVGIIDFRSVSVSMNRVHYTNSGIKENGTFSVNVPSVRMVVETDYCGLVSGSKFDKASIFDVFYGALENAPMIEGCPLNMECRLAHTLEMPQHDVFVGEIVETWCEEECLNEGGVDYEAVGPILFTMDDKGYWRLGARFADAWEAGKELLKKNKA
jgi:flavin reductase (DIM6/NTAB) family NADH-FMN oxidoreductase RutF